MLALRRSGSHVEGEATFRGRGLYFHRTPDGTWWRVRLRARRCDWVLPDDFGEPPATGGVREPRRPLGPGPSAGAIEL